MTGTSVAVQTTCRRPVYRPYRNAGRKAEYGRFSVLPRPEIYRNLRIKDGVKIDCTCFRGGVLYITHKALKVNGQCAINLMFYDVHKEDRAA